MEVTCSLHCGRSRRRTLRSLVPDCAILDGEFGTAFEAPTGDDDLVGVCPCPPSYRYCLCTFPPEDHIRELAHLWMFSDSRALEPAVEWYPPEVSRPRGAVPG